MNRKGLREANLHCSVSLQLTTAVLVPILVFAHDALCLETKDLDLLDNFQSEVLNAIISPDPEDRAPLGWTLLDFGLLRSSETVRLNQLRLLWRIGHKNCKNVAKKVLLRFPDNPLSRCVRTFGFDWGFPDLRDLLIETKTKYQLRSLIATITSVIKARQAPLPIQPLARWWDTKDEAVGLHKTLGELPNQHISILARARADLNYSHYSSRATLCSACSLHRRNTLVHAIVDCTATRLENIRISIRNIVAIAPTTEWLAGQRPLHLSKFKSY